MNALADALREYLRKQWPECQDVSIEGLCELLGGYSKRTYSFDAHLSRNGQPTILPLILRRDRDPTQEYVVTSRAREHELLCRLRQHTALPVPQSYFAEMDPAIFGQPAMIIERVLGCTEPTTLFRSPEGTAAAPSVGRQLCEALAALHTADLRQLNSDGLFNDPNGAGVVADTWDHYIDGMLNFFIANYRTIDFDTIPVLYDSYFHMRRNKPRPLPLVLTHGDIHALNILVADRQIKAIIDWEYSHLGDPREELSHLRYRDGLFGTHLFDRIDHPGGFLGYYNELTGFAVTSEELDYFLMFELSNEVTRSFKGLKRSIQGRHQELESLYLIQATMEVVGVFSQLLGYQQTSG